MRLDIFLKTSRLCPRRAVAQELCDAGAVSINGRTAKSAHTVRLGDEITIRRRDRVFVARILNVRATGNVSRRDAHCMYEVVAEKRLEPLED